MASVDLRGLTKRFGSLAVVDDVSLRIDHGQLVCLLGPSGCGKTTTLRLIAGFLEPSDGEIHVGDRLVSSKARTLPPEQRKMSMIFQSYALWPHMTVTENIVYGLRLRKMDRDTIAKKLAAILTATKLEVLAQRYPGELSGGQQQRVALARALIVEPETLLLDEPLSNLDANLREEMRFEIRRLHDEYRYTTVYVTHDQSEAMTTADLIAVMNAGKIDQLGTPEDIYDRPQSEFVARFIGASNVIKGTARDDNHIVVCRRDAAGDRREAQRRPERRGRDPPARHPAFDAGAARQQNAVKADRDAPGLSRRQPRLHGGNPRRHQLARDHADRERRAQGRRGLADSAAGTLPGAEPITRKTEEDAMKRRKLSRRDVLKGPQGRPRWRSAPCSPPRPAPRRRRRSASRRQLIEAAKKEGKVVLYSSMDLPVGEKLGKAFEAAYPRHRGADRALRLRAAVPADRPGIRQQRPRRRYHQHVGRLAPDHLEEERLAAAVRAAKTSRSIFKPEHRDPDGMSAASRV